MSGNKRPDRARLQEAGEKMTGTSWETGGERGGHVWGVHTQHNEFMPAVG